MTSEETLTDALPTRFLLFPSDYPGELNLQVTFISELHQLQLSFCTKNKAFQLILKSVYNGFKVN